MEIAIVGGLALVGATISLLAMADGDDTLGKISLISLMLTITLFVLALVK